MKFGHFARPPADRARPTTPSSELSCCWCGGKDRSTALYRPRHYNRGPLRHQDPHPRTCCPPLPNSPRKDMGLLPNVRATSASMALDHSDAIPCRASSARLCLRDGDTADFPPPPSEALWLSGMSGGEDPAPSPGVPLFALAEARLLRWRWRRWYGGHCG